MNYENIYKRILNRRYAYSNSRRKLLREFVIDVFLEISMVTRVEGTFLVSLLATRFNKYVETPVLCLGVQQ